MAKSAALTEPILAHAAPKVSELAAFAGAVDISLELGEAFQLWLLPDAAILEFNSFDPLTKANPINQWHVQLYSGSKPWGFATLSPIGPAPEDWRVTSVFQSTVAEGVNHVIDEIDRQFEDKSEAHLIHIPAYQLYAFWLNKSGANFVVPACLPAAYSTLERGHAYPSREFFSMLAKLPHVRGFLRH